MKRYIIYVVSILVLSACRSDIPADNGIGTLCISNLLPASIDVVQTKSTSNTDFALEIWKDDQMIKSYAANDDTKFKKIILDEGTYLLKVFSENINETWNDVQLGNPKYYKEEEVTIVNEHTTYVTIKVPVVNLGVCYLLSDEVKSLLSNYAFTAIVSGRSVTIGENETAWFDMPVSGTADLSVSFTAQNSDSEWFTQANVYSDLSAGHLYQVTYSWQTRSLTIQTKEIME